MFEKLIMTLIVALENITKEIKRTYYETYGDKRLTREFYDEVSIRCQANKELFIRKAAGFVGKKILEEEGYLIPPVQAMMMGEIMFNSAKNTGLIDSLNNVIER